MHIMLVPCITCNSFYLITLWFLPCFSLSSLHWLSPWQTENMPIQKLFLPIIGKVFMHNWKNAVIPVTTVLFPHSSNMSIMAVSAWVVCLWWIRSHAPERTWQKKNGISHFSHWGLTGCETQRVKLEHQSCQVFHYMGLCKGPQSPFL